MDDFLRFFGALHMLAYTLWGLLWLSAYLVYRAGKYWKFLSRVIEWGVAKYRWDNRHEDGLTDAEWQRGEPKP